MIEPGGNILSLIDFICNYKLLAHLAPVFKSS